MGVNLLAGFDESNHGRSPEIFVGVFSSIRSDGAPKGSLINKKGFLPKIRKT